MLHMYRYLNKPFAVTSLLFTCTVISIDDGLLRTSTGCASSSSPLTLYIDWLNVTKGSKQNI